MNQAIERPGWHSDVKWVCGLIAAFAIWITLALFALSALTSERVAVPVASAFLSTALLGNGEMDDAEAALFIKQLQAQPGDVLYPLPGQPTSVTRQELSTLSIDELQPLIVRRLVESYYDLGIAGVAAQQNMSAEQIAMAERNAGLMKWFNRDTHDLLARYALIAALVTLLPFAGLIFFSYQVGRLVSPGLVMFLIALPGTLITGLAYLTTSEAAGSGGPIPYLGAAETQQIAQSIFPLYAGVCLIGFGLLLTALIWHLVRSGRARRAAAPLPKR